LEWIYQNRERYNIRVVNLSLNSTVAESYHTSPLDAAVEILWLNNIVVVVSAGNNEAGPANGILFPPANDPFVITVGATDDRGTTTRNDDVLASFSAHGTTTDGFRKPDLVAPGKNIVGLLASPHTVLAQEHANHVVEHEQKQYFRMSGTSMAAPVVAGTVALLLQDEPHLTPDQVKYRLTATTRPFASPGAGAGYLDAYAAIHGTTRQVANTGVRPSELINLNSDGSTTGSVSWTSVSWTSVSWTSVSWTSVSWSSDYWEE
jgi:serine protease AprX